MPRGFVAWPEEAQERYRRAGYWLGEHLGDIGRPAQGADREAVAVVAGTQRLTYAEFDERCDRIAAGLYGAGIRPGDHVVVQLPNIVEFPLVVVGLFRLSALPVLALPAHRKVEIAYLCRHVDAVAYVICDRLPDVAGKFDFRDLAREVRDTASALEHVIVVGEPEEFSSLADVEASASTLPDPGPPDPGGVAFFLLSGGTTNVPKLIPRTHDDYAYQMRETASAMGLGPGGAYLAALPAAHNAALGCPGVLGALRVGARAVLASSPSPDEVFGLIAREGVTLTTLMPAFLPLWTELVDLFGVDLSGLTIEVGGAPLTREAAAEVEPRLGCTLTRWFGMAEGLLSFTRPEDPLDVRVATEGRPLSAADEIRVVDDDDREVAPGEVGHLLTRGPYTLRGYYRSEDYNERAFTVDGFLRTGDLVRLTPRGDMVVVGRVKDVVNRAGEKVSAEEVEAYLVSHPSVREAAVIALPEPDLGERTCAVVVAHGEPPALAALKAYLAELGVAPYKAPDQLEIVDALPRTSLGKVNKAALREEFTG